jgi:hypothetical protein
VVATAGRNRGVGVRHQLRDDLDEINPALRKVLAKVAATDGADSDGIAGQHSRHPGGRD